MPTGPKGQKRPADVIGNAVRVMRIATGEEADDVKDDGKDPAAKALGAKGGKKRAENMTPWIDRLAILRYQRPPFDRQPRPSLAGQSVLGRTCAAGPRRRTRQRALGAHQGDSRRCRSWKAPEGVCRMTWVAGADGFKKGWYVVLANLDTDAWSARVVPSFATLLELPETPSVVCVDMPIGLPEHTPPGGRQCEAMARSVLGPRRSSVFSAVGRQALGCASRAEADGLSTGSGGIGIGAQAWGLAAKLREVDHAMTVVAGHCHRTSIEGLR